MAAGRPVTKQEIDIQVGNALHQLHVVMVEIAELKDTLDTMSGSYLETQLGYSATDAAVIKSAIGDAGQFVRVFEGAEAVTPAKDFRVFIRQLWGLGTR